VATGAMRSKITSDMQDKVDGVGSTLSDEFGSRPLAAAAETTPPSLKGSGWSMLTECLIWNTGAVATSMEKAMHIDGSALAGTRRAAMEGR
jgi:hypothetical protein